jgi:hypothetical protein
LKTEVKSKKVEPKRQKREVGKGSHVKREKEKGHDKVEKGNGDKIAASLPLLSSST